LLFGVDDADEPVANEDLGFRRLWRQTKLPRTRRKCDSIFFVSVDVRGLGRLSISEPGSEPTAQAGTPG
jgi:hypothetical protein